MPESDALCVVDIILKFNVSSGDISFNPDVTNVDAFDTCDNGVVVDTEKRQ